MTRALWPLAIIGIIALAGCSSPTPTSAPNPESRPTIDLIFITPSPAEAGSYLESAIADVTAVAADRGESIEVYASADYADIQVQVDNALAAKPGVIVGIGAEVSSKFDFAAASNLDQQFVILDAQAPEPTANLTASVFRSYETLYLTGVEAALLSGNDQAGMVGPAETNRVISWGEMFTKGFLDTTPDGLVTLDNADDELDPDPARVLELAKAQADQKIPIVQTIEMPASVGLFDGAADDDYSTFGHNIDQCSLAAGHVIDSAIKHLDVAFAGALQQVDDGNTGGATSYGLANKGVSLAGLDAAEADADSACTITDDPTTVRAVIAVRDRIVSGELVLDDPDYIK